MPDISTSEFVPATYGPERQFTEIGVSALSEAYVSIAAGVPKNRARPRRRVRETLRLPRFELTITQCGDGSWIADEPVTGQFGVGPTPLDAVGDLFATISGYLKVMQARRHHLAPHLLKQLEWLEGANR